MTDFPSPVIPSLPSFPCLYRRIRSELIGRACLRTMLLIGHIDTTGPADGRTDGGRAAPPPPRREWRGSVRSAGASSSVRGRAGGGGQVGNQVEQTLMNVKRMSLFRRRSSALLPPSLAHSLLLAP